MGGDSDWRWIDFTARAAAKGVRGRGNFLAHTDIWVRNGNEFLCDLLLSRQRGCILKPGAAVNRRTGGARVRNAIGSNYSIARADDFSAEPCSSGCQHIAWGAINRGFDSARAVVATWPAYFSQTLAIGEKRRAGRRWRDFTAALRDWHGQPFGAANLSLEAERRSLAGYTFACDASGATCPAGCRTARIWPRNFPRGFSFSE